MSFKIPKIPAALGRSGKGYPSLSDHSVGQEESGGGAKRKALFASEEREEEQEQLPQPKRPHPLSSSAYSSAREIEEEIMGLVDVTPAQDISVSTLKRHVLNLERSITKNVQLRAKFANEPMRFMESEQELDNQLKLLTSSLSGVPHLLPALLELGLSRSLLALVLHENTDISNAVLNLLSEWTDDETLEDELTPEADAGLKALVYDLIEKDCLNILVQNLSRFDEGDDESDDKIGVYNTLAILENFISIDSTLNEKIAQSSSILPWMLNRLRTRKIDTNRQYCAELLSIFLMEAENTTKWRDIGGLESLLASVAPYKRRDPSDDDELELLENLFDCLCFSVSGLESKRSFLHEQGIELMGIMLAEGKRCRTSALKVLSLLVTENDRDVDLFRSLADTIIDVCDIRVLIHIFRQKGLKSYRKTYTSSYSEKEEEEHILSILVFLFKYTSDVTTLTKACSSSDAVTRMIDLHYTYAHKLAEEEPRIQASLAPLADEPDLTQRDIDLEFYLARCDVGLFTLQTVDILISYACKNNPALRDVFLLGFEQVELEFSAVYQILEQMIVSLDSRGGQEDFPAQMQASQEIASLLPFVRVE